MSINTDTQSISKPTFVKVKLQNRTYIYLDGRITFPNIISINVSKAGTHRLNSRDGKKYVVMPGFKAVEFDAKDWTF